MANARSVVENLLAKADVKINGARPWDITVHDDRFYARVLAGGSLALGESYMDGWWDSAKLDELFGRVLRLYASDSLVSPTLVWNAIKGRLINEGQKRFAFEVGKRHYDLGNDLYRAMLDARMIYSCGYWSSPTTPAKNLDDAQEQKLDLVCRKIGLAKGDHILDIGCGWGGFAKFAAEKYGASVVGVTVSVEQAALARENCKGLPVEIRICDYRELNEQFDHIISIGMFEHVSYKNYREYFNVARRCLKDDGIFLLHTIGGNRTVHSNDAWIAKHIFPRGMLPSIAQIGRAVERLFVVEDWHNFGADYDKTLVAWFENFDRAWPRLKEKYGESFYRMWKYYLLCCAGAFRARYTELWQIALSKRGLEGGYASVR